MEDFKKNLESDKEIVFSKSVKAGKRIYYVDVKKNRKGELFIALTESKKIISNETENPSVNFEKHKIFLYQEDLDKFLASLTEAVGYIRKEQPGTDPQPAADNNDGANSQELHIDMDLDDIQLDEK